MEKNGRILFDRPKPTVGCSACGRIYYDAHGSMNVKDISTFSNLKFTQM
jgi:ribosomal protein S27E